MQVSVGDIRKNFQSRTDTELVDLANSKAEITSEARILLLQELRDRLVRTKQSAEEIQLRHGWYTVISPTAGVKFPDFCPRCSKPADSNAVRFQSPQERRFRSFYWKTITASSNVPHCSNCAAELKQSRRLCSWIWGLTGFLWIATSIWLELPRFVIYIGIFTVSAPFVYLYDRTSAVKLGNSTAGLVEYRFRSHHYAKSFAVLNNLQAQNTETLLPELEAAISRINVAPSVPETPSR